nr:hypothetical protein CFP56_52565 [Quercus suber]
MPVAADSIAPFAKLRDCVAARSRYRPPREEIPPSQQDGVEITDGVPLNVRYQPRAGRRGKVLNKNLRRESKLRQGGGVRAGDRSSHGSRFIVA